MRDAYAKAQRITGVMDVDAGKARISARRLCIGRKAGERLKVACVTRTVDRVDCREIEWQLNTRLMREHQITRVRAQRKSRRPDIVANVNLDATDVATQL